MFENSNTRVACRCLWDSDTDNYAQDIFMTVRAGVVLLYYLKRRLIKCSSSHQGRTQHQ